MEEREVVIIKRLHKIVKMPVLKTAKAVGRHKKEHLQGLEDAEALVAWPCTLAQPIGGAAYRHRSQAVGLESKDTL